MVRREIWQVKQYQVRQVQQQGFMGQTRTGENQECSCFVCSALLLLPIIFLTTGTRRRFLLFLPFTPQAQQCKTFNITEGTSKVLKPFDPAVVGSTGVFELDGSYMTGILVDSLPLPNQAQVNLNIPVVLADNSTSFVTFAGIATNPGNIPSTANLILTGTPPGVELTGSLTLAFDFNNPLNGTAVLCGDLDSITARVDEDGDEDEGGGLLRTLGLWHIN